jgi:hypothetical protein
VIKVPMTSQYFESTCDIKSNETELKGHIEIDKSNLYTSLPCYAYSLSNTRLNQIFGISNTGRYKFHFPLTFDESDVSIKEHYIIHWTDKGNIVRTLQIEIIEYKSSHIEAEAVEVSLV